MARNHPERDIQNAILEYLTYKRVFHFRIKNTGFKTARGWIPSGIVGVPDIIAIHKGVTYGIEVKTPTGRQSEAQIAFQRDFERGGAIYLLVRSIDDVIEHFKAL